MAEFQDKLSSAQDLNDVAVWYAEVAQLFLVAAMETLEGLAELRAARGALRFIRSAYTESDITVAISVDGALNGLVLLGLSYRTAFRLLQHMLGEELDSNLPISDFLQESELARSALQELANTLAGRAAMHLEAAGKVCMISPPQLTMRRGILLSHRDFQRLVIPLETPVGTLRLEIALMPGDTQGNGGCRDFFVAQHIVRPQQFIARYDFANPDRLGRSVYALLQQVHDRFPLTLNQLMTVRGRVGARLSPLRLEKDSCAHFLRREYDWSVAAFFQVVGHGVWVLALSRSIALLLIDRWLGGPGQMGERIATAWTPLEQAVLQAVMATVGDAYAIAWTQVTEQVTLRLTHVLTGDWTAQASTMLNEGSGALLLSHRIHIGEEVGVLQWLLPADTLLGFSERHRRTASRPSATPLARSVVVTLRCGWQSDPIPLRQLAQLKVGDLLPLHHPLVLWHDNRVIGTGKPFRKGNRIVVQVMPTGARSPLTPFGADGR
ncbi:CheY-P phosphatase CheX [bacterium HR17]|uniref:Flagellar motor switch protein FliM n=1 Tax=Candidatus Fervidibacter japonicus TaxID=2035412 RepID=A0A2H5XEY0_9BACT|nr:CheY-P phosphatase CheX [bacterium HR17]